MRLGSDLILGVSGTGTAIGCGFVLADVIAKGAWWPLALIFGALLAMCSGAGAIGLCRYAFGRK